jgi:phytoene synthase
MIDGWEGIVVAETIDDDVLAAYCRARGEEMFAIAASLTGSGFPALAAAGRAWAAADLAAGLSDPAVAAAAVQIADTAWSAAFSTRWPAALRPVGALSLIAMLDRRAGSPIGKALRVTRFRITGR